MTVKAGAGLTLGDVVEEGRKQSGLTDLHLDGLGGRLDKLLRNINEDLDLDAAGYDAARKLLGEFLSERGKLLEDRVKNPAIAEEVIKSPIFVTGLPRSGTTLLHMVVGADPKNRLPKWWEVRYPSPPPSSGIDVEKRKKLADEDVAGLMAADKSLLQWHPYYDEGSEAAPECEHFGVIDFQFVRRTMSYHRIKALVRDGLIESDDSFFDWHQKTLQHMQYGSPTPRWALKGTEDFARLDSLKRHYPDAKILWIHRDPQRVLPSMLAMAYNVATGVTGREMDKKAFADGLLAYQVQVLKKGLASPVNTSSDLKHVRYADFAKNPVEYLREVYESFDLPFTEETGDAMRHWLATNKGDRHGKFRYTLEDFGYSRDELEELFADYRAEFDIPLEGVHA